LYVAYKDNPKVAMFLVYVREAHPARETVESQDTHSEKHRGLGIAQHKTIHDRVWAASACMEGLKLTLPVLIDTMDGVVETAYQGLPAATAVVDLDGNLVFHSRGPSGVQPKQADKVLKTVLGGGPPAETR
jgi:hypothetical protein